MNLYHVYDLNLKIVVREFPSRKAAKEFRDPMNAIEHGDKLAEASQTGNGLRFIVGRGSDHPKGPTKGPVFRGKRYFDE